MSPEGVSLYNQGSAENPVAGIGHAAVVLVDNQTEFLAPGGLLSRLGANGMTPGLLSEYVRSTNTLLAAARRARVPVVHVVTLLSTSYADSALSRSWEARGFNRETQALVTGTYGANIFEGIRVETTDEIVVKKGHGAFQFTVLDRLLRNLGVRTIYWGGGAVGGCLSDSVSKGAALGYEQKLVHEVVYPLGHLALPGLRGAADVVELASACGAFDASLGAPSVEGGKGKKALLVMDAQESVFAPNEGLTTIGRPEVRTGILQSIKELLGAARAGECPVVFISSLSNGYQERRSSRPEQVVSTPLPRVGEKIDYLPGLAPEPGEAELVKFGEGAFTATPLHQVLRDENIDHVVVAGGDASALRSVDATAREGVGLGYDITLVRGTFCGDEASLDGPLANRATAVTLGEAVAILGDRELGSDSR